MPYLIESHLGGKLYEVRDYKDEDLYCEECGDSDHVLGWFNTEEERKKLIDDYYYDDCDY